MSQDFVRRLPGHERDMRSTWLHAVHIEPVLFMLLSCVIAYGLVILFSAVGENAAMFRAQLTRMALAFAALAVAAQLPPRLYIAWAPFIYVGGVLLLVLVLLFGVGFSQQERLLLQQPQCCGIPCRTISARES